MRRNDAHLKIICDDSIGTSRNGGISTNCFTVSSRSLPIRLKQQWHTAWNEHSVLGKQSIKKEKEQASLHLAQ